MSAVVVNLSDLDYSLMIPCDDCPFKRTTPCHDGVFKDLINISSSVERGQFIHTCHKTDHRSDGFVVGYKGPVKHCAGAIGMLKNMGEEGIQTVWLQDKTKNVFKIKPHPDVFSGFKEMVKKYLQHYGKIL